MANHSHRPPQAGAAAFSPAAASAPAAALATAHSGVVGSTASAAAARPVLSFYLKPDLASITTGGSTSSTCLFPAAASAAGSHVVDTHAVAAWSADSASSDVAPVLQSECNEPRTSHGFFSSSRVSRNTISLPSPFASLSSSAACCSPSSNALSLPSSLPVASSLLPVFDAPASAATTASQPRHAPSSSPSSFPSSTSPSTSSSSLSSSSSSSVLSFFLSFASGLLPSPHNSDAGAAAGKERNVSGTACADALNADSAPAVAADPTIAVPADSTAVLADPAAAAADSPAVAVDSAADSAAGSTGATIAAPAAAHPPAAAAPAAAGPAAADAAASFPPLHFCTETNDPVDPCNAQWLLLYTYAAYASPRPSEEEQRQLRLFFEKFPDQCVSGPAAWCYSEAMRASPPRVQNRRDLLLWLCLVENQCRVKAGLPTRPCRYTELVRRWRYDDGYL